MTKGPMFPYLLSLGLIIVGSLPAIFLPETLEDAKAKRTKQPEPEQHDGTEPLESAEPLESDKRTVIQELTRQAREFSDSTRFIWSDFNVVLMVMVLFVTVMSRQCTNLLLQYVSAKFDWSIGRVSTPSCISTHQTNQATVQSPHIIARDIRLGDLPTPHAIRILRSGQVFQLARQAKRPYHEQGKWNTLRHWIHGCIHWPQPCLLDWRSGRPVHRLGVHGDDTQSSDFSCCPRPCRHLVFSDWNRPGRGSPRFGSVVRKPLSARPAPRQGMDGTPIPDGGGIFHFRRGGCLERQARAIARDRRGAGASLILDYSSICNHCRPYNLPRAVRCGESEVSYVVQHIDANVKSSIAALMKQASFWFVRA